MILFRCGGGEQLALPLAEVRRVVMVQRKRIERIGDRELVIAEGATVNVLRLDRLLGLSACPDQDVLFLILPRRDGAGVGLLASEIVDMPTLPVRIDPQAYRADGVRGSMLIRGQIVLFLDLDRVLELGQQAEVARPALPAGAGRRVLVVEDTEFFRQLIKSNLESAGHEVVLAANGSEGLERLAEASFDLVVSDIEMPLMDGLGFARRVREEPRFASLPLLAVTTLTGDADRAEALASGFDAYEIKLERKRFMTRVAQLLEQGRAGAMLPGAAEHG
jgi:two-component system chemotaxis sensor kinase CheA